MPMTMPQNMELRGKLITGDHKEFMAAPWAGRNESGAVPLDDKVLVLMDEHVEQTSMGIIIPTQNKDRMDMAAETGVIVAIGPAAFQWSDDMSRKWIGRKPEPGDRCYVTRYSGQIIYGHDGKLYRLMSQPCVGALIELEPSPATSRKRKAAGRKG